MPNEHRSGLFVHADLDAVAKELISWGGEIGRATRGERKRLSLSEAWKFVDEARIFAPNRAFLIPIGEEWTAFFDNHSREFSAASKLFILCKRLRVDTCFFSYDHSPATEHCGSSMFSYRRLVGTEVVTRQVMFSKEGGWKLTQFGDPLPFEDLAAYQLPKKKDRLTPELLRRYGQALGIHFWDPAAYGNRVYLHRWGQGGPDPQSVIKKAIELFGKPKAIFGKFRK